MSKPIADPDLDIQEEVMKAIHKGLDPFQASHYASNELELSQMDYRDFMEMFREEYYG